MSTYYLLYGSYFASNNRREPAVLPPKAEVVSSNLAGCAIFVASSAGFRTLRHPTYVAC